MAELVEQMKIEVADEVGKLAQVTSALKAAEVNIQAACAWTMKGKGHMLLVTSDNAKACAALSELVEACESQQVVLVTVANEVGMLNVVAGKLSDAGININMCYATAGGGDVAVVLDTADNEKATSLL